jgi:Hemerythrin HHE cation binding domain
VSDSAGIAALGAIFTTQLRHTVEVRLAATPLAAHAHAIAAGIGGPKASGAQSGLTAAARHAVAAATQAGFADSLNAILLIGAAVAAVAAVASLALIRGRDFAAEPAAPDYAHRAAAEPRDDIPADQPGVPMTTDDQRRRPLQGKVDFTLMYAAHDAFHRDLRCLTAEVEAGQTADPAVRTGWATFKNQLHIHHTAEDTSLWPPLRQKVTRLEDTAVLDAMEAEHARFDPLLSRVDASLAASDRAGLAGNTQALTAHTEHEEDQALPLIETHLGPVGWAAFRKAVGKKPGPARRRRILPLDARRRARRN